MNPIVVKSNTYTDFGKENSDKYPKFKIGDNVRISKFNFFFAKSYIMNWSEEVLAIKKLKFMYRENMLLIIKMEKGILKRFMKTNCKKINQNEFRIERVIKVIEKVINYMLNGKAMIFWLLVG